MSLIHRKYKYSPSFKPTETIVYHKEETQNTVLLTSQNLSIEGPNSPYFESSCNTLPNPYNYYFGQLDGPLSPKESKKITTICSSLTSRHKPKDEILIGDLFHPTGEDIKLKHIPIISLKTSANMSQKLSPLPLDTTKSPLSSYRLNQTKDFSSNGLSTDRKRSKDPKLDPYLSYLGRINGNLIEDRLNKKLRWAMKMKTIDANDNSTALGMNLQLINSIVPINYRENSAKQEISLLSDRRPSIMQYTGRDSQNEKGSAVFNDKNHVITPLDTRKGSYTEKEAHTITDLKKHTTQESKKNKALVHQTSIESLPSVTTPKGRKKHQGDGNTHKVERASLMMTKHHMKRSSTYNMTSGLFKEIVQNLHELRSHNLNDRRFFDIVSVLADNNSEILKLILAKHHHVHDYDPVKLEQKFAMIELITENLSIPVKLQKKKDGITLIETNLLPSLQAFSRKLEDFNIKKRYETLKMVETGMKETKKKLEVFEHQKAKSLFKRGKFEEFRAIEASINNNNHNNHNNHNGKSSHYSASFGADPVQGLVEYQRNQSDYDHLKRRNVDYALYVNEVFRDWKRQGISHNP